MITRFKLFVGHEIVGKITQTLVVRMLTTFFMAVAGLLIIKELSIHDNGSYSYLNSVVNISLQCVSAGFAAGIVYFGSYQSGHKVRRILRLGTLVILLVSPLSFFLGRDYLQYSLLVSAIFVLMALGSYGNSLFLSQKAVRTTNVADLTQSILFLGIIFGLFLTHHGSIYSTLIALMLSLVAKDLFYLVQIRRPLIRDLLDRQDKDQQGDDTRAILTRATLVNILAYLALSIDIVILRWMKSPSDVGIYSLATNVSSLFIIVPGVISTILFPYFAESIAAGRAVNKRQLIIFSVSLSLVLAALFLGVGRYFIFFVGGSRYGAALMPLKLLTGGVFFLSLQMIIGQEVIAHSFPKQIAYIWSVGFISNVIFNFILIPRYSYNGSAVATTLSYGIVAIYIVWFYLTKKYDTETAKNER